MWILECKPVLEIELEIVGSFALCEVLANWPSAFCFDFRKAAKSQNFRKIQLKNPIGKIQSKKITEKKSNALLVIKSGSKIRRGVASGAIRV
jgi:hypothetical protein